MKELDPVDKFIVRSWSAIVAKDGMGTADEVAALVGLKIEDVVRRMTTLRAICALSSPTLDVA